MRRIGVQHYRDFPQMAMLRPTPTNYTWDAGALTSLINCAHVCVCVRTCLPTCLPTCMFARLNACQPACRFCVAICFSTGSLLRLCILESPGSHRKFPDRAKLG